jgi:hypothetical protein
LIARFIAPEPAQYADPGALTVAFHEPGWMENTLSELFPVY